MAVSSIQEVEIRDPSAIDHEKTLIVGLGNPILGDDGVGWRIKRFAGWRVWNLGPISST